MPFNGAGVFSKIYSWVADAAAGIDISSSRMDAQESDFATAFDLCLTRDGQGQPISNLPMANFRHTGAANGVALTDYATMGQLQNAGVVSWVAAGGSADALTATYAPALTTLADGQLCFVRAANSNATTTPTFAPNAVPAHTITKFGGTALAVGDIAALKEMILRYNLANTRWELLNPSIAVIAPNSIVTASIADANVTYGKIQNVAASRIVGNPTGAPAAMAEISLSASFSFSGSSLILADSGVSYAKIQNVTASKLVGNPSGGAAAPSEISLASSLAFAGTALGVADAGVTYAKIQNVSASRLVGNPTGGVAAPSEISLSASFGFSGTVIVLANSGVAYGNIQNVTAARLLGNPSGGAAAPSEISLGQGLGFSGSSLISFAIAPTTQVLTSGTGATYTTPAGVKWLEVLVVGGSSGGGGGNSAVLSTAGGASSFSTLSAGGGSGSSYNVAGAGGTASGGYSNCPGAPGNPGNGPGLNHNATGGAGGNTVLGGAGAGANANNTGASAAANSGSGGGGGGSTNGSLDGAAGCGGASGGWVRAIIGAPAATYTYTVGAGGAGAAGASINSSAGGAGGPGAAGCIVVIEHY